MVKKQPTKPGPKSSVPSDSVGACRDCSGRGQRPWAEYIIFCETCAGTGIGNSAAGPG